MKYDTEKIDETTLALLYLVTWQEKYGICAWKSFEWDTMNRLHEKGWISDPKSKAKSVVMTEEGHRKSEELFQGLFGTEE
jgi:hypothetical protein